MDPDKALAACREAMRNWERAERGSAAEFTAAEEFTGSFAALDAWLSQEGFLPRAWQSLADDLCHAVRVAGVCSLPRDHSGSHDWE